jgi:AcrR family transcriptional regulator
MSPRPYRLGQRRVAAEQTRARVIAAARVLLTSSRGFAGFTIDAVARQAGVARMTVYYQFASKAGLLEALFDDLADRGGMEQLPSAFGRPDPLDALDDFVAVFCRFWASDRLIIRRLQGLAALDPDFQQVSREERRREGLRVILRRLADRNGRPSPDAFEEAVDVLHLLTSFQSYDNLAGGGRGPEAVAALIRRLARAALGLPRPPSPPKAHVIL